MLKHNQDRQSRTSNFNKGNASWEEKHKEFVTDRNRNQMRSLKEITIYSWQDRQKRDTVIFIRPWTITPYKKRNKLQPNTISVITQVMISMIAKQTNWRKPKKKNI